VSAEATSRMRRSCSPGRRERVGISGFGATGAGPELYKHFGITLEAVAAAAEGLVES